MRRLSVLVAAALLTGCADLRSVREDRGALELLTNPERAEVRNEYGWICEYSAVGVPPDQRLATNQLVRNNRVDMLREALRGPNLEGRVYAAEALLYLDTLGVELNEADREAIYILRESAEEVRTCGTGGSYKIYLVPIREVLSDSAVAEIPENYQSLGQVRYR